MKFATDGGKDLMVSLNHVRDDLVSADVEDAMEAMIDQEFFAEAILGISGADIVDRVVTVLF
jgi:hypothetical protein